ncbi:MAG TPA: hypothetical protein DD662_01430 [Planctomycetaceae bacterium]|nr:hypothetical protein [Planctomycetaceae bacterium]
MTFPHFFAVVRLFRRFVFWTKRNITEPTACVIVLFVMTHERLVVDHGCPWFGLAVITNTVKPFH